MNGQVGVSHALRAKGWAHPREGLTIDDLAGRMPDVANTVIEVHRSCACEGAMTPGVPDDHLLLLDAEVTNG